MCLLAFQRFSQSKENQSRVKLLQSTIVIVFEVAKLLPLLWTFPDGSFWEEGIVNPILLAITGMAWKTLLRENNHLSVTRSKAIRV